MNFHKTVFIYNYLRVIMDAQDFTFVIFTYSGLEKVLSKELMQLGGREIEINIGNVSCKGDKGFMYKTNFCLRTATSVMLKIKDFSFSDTEDLISGMDVVSWDSYLNSKQSFNVKCSSSAYSSHSKTLSSAKAQEIIKDYFSNNGKDEPALNENNPDVEINIIIGYDKCSLMLNSSGESLKTRGYNTENNSISEILAAGIILLSGWESHRPLVDFNCDSGIIPVEAALIAAKIPPGAFKKDYAFERWTDFEPELFQLIREKQIDRIIDSKVRIFANESDKMKAEITLANIQAASVEDMITFTEDNFFDFKRPESSGGTVIIYLPKKQSKASNEDIAAYLKNNFTGFNIFILTDDPDLPKVIGIKSKERIRLQDDESEYRLLSYEL